MNCNCTEHSGLLAEGKSFGTRRVFSDEKSMLMNALVRLVGSLKGNLDQKLIKDSIDAYDDLKDEFKDSLFGILQSYQAGEITVDEFEKMIQTEIRNAWSTAYDLGVGSAGNPFGVYDEDKTWLKGARAEEYGYLKGFVDALDTDEFVMDPEKRMGMYVDTLDGIFNHGQVEGHPDYVDIYWELGDAEHCPDCIELAANSPYTKDTLPSCPGDGSTVCLSNCQCSLRYEISDRAPEAMAVKTPEVPGMKVPSVPEGYRLPTYAEYEAISSMQSEAERLKGIISATTGDLKKDLISQRTDIVHEYTAMIDTNNLYFVPKSNYYQGAFGSDIGESTEINRKIRNIPDGCRSASLKEKNRIDAMAYEINHLRELIAAGPQKSLIAERHLLTEEMVSYMERHKIYYIPMGLFGEMIAERSKILLIEQESRGLINNLFGARM